MIDNIFYIYNIIIKITTSDMFKNGPLVMRTNIDRELKFLIRAHTIPTYYQHDMKQGILAQREELLLDYVLAKQHRLIGTTHRGIVFLGEDGVEWGIFGVSADWFCRYLRTMSPEQMNTILYSISLSCHIDSIEELAVIFSNYKEPTNLGPWHEIDPLSSADLVKIRNVLFANGPVYDGDWNDINDSDADLVVRAYTSNQLPAYLQNRDDVSQCLLFAATETDFVNAFRRQDIIFDGINDNKLPTWRRRGQGQYEDGSPYRGYNPDLEADNINDGYVVGLSPSGYEVLLRLENPIEVIRVMEQSTKKKYNSIQAVAMDLYVATNTNSLYV